MSDIYISKDYLLKELKELNIVSFYELNEHSKEAYEDFKGLVENAPFKVAKEGAWNITDEWANSLGDVIVQVECPFCKQREKFYALPIPKYCEECGAHLGNINIFDDIKIEEILEDL